MTDLKSALALAGKKIKEKSSQLILRLLHSKILNKLTKKYEARRFYDSNLRKPNSGFKQSYDLLSQNFGSGELEPQETYNEMLKQTGDHKTREHLPVFIGRFPKWPYFDPDHPAEKTPQASVPVIGVVSGSYIVLDENEALGALGHMVTHALFRKGQGHGSYLLEDFEKELARVAAQQAKRLRLIILESQPDARQFWAKRGFRLLGDAQYYQPALEFDLQTGEPLSEAVPEFLMVKMLPVSEMISEIDQALLMKVVRTVYQHWYVPSPEDFSPAANQRIQTYLFDELLPAFEATLPADGQPVKL